MVNPSYMTGDKVPITGRYEIIANGPHQGQAVTLMAGASFPTDPSGNLTAFWRVG